jgi:Mrp family chromosome partitioning ATPase
MANETPGGGGLPLLPGDASAYLYQAVAMLEGVVPADRFAVGLASCHHGTGTSSVAWHFASMLAASGRRPVCLVEANLRTPVLAGGALGLRTAPGLRELLAGEADLEAAVQQSSWEELSVITAGAAGATDVSMFSRRALAGVVERIRERFRAVVFDLAPVLPYPDTVAVAPHLDGVVLVLHAERDKSEIVQRGARLLEGAGARIEGAILNRKPLYIPRWIYRLL